MSGHRLDATITRIIREMRVTEVVLAHPDRSILITMTKPEGEEPSVSWSVYIVECADQTLYTGITTSPERRISQHNNGSGAKYTRQRRPVNLVYLELLESRSAALKREYAIKQLSASAKRALVRSAGE